MTELDELRARVDALERQAAGGGVSNLFPNVITRAANGAIGANLSGHLAAQGVDLPSSEVGINPTGNTEVRWLRTSDGAVVADIWGFDDPLGGETVLNLEAQGLGNFANVALSSRSGGHVAGLDVRVGASGPGSVTVNDDVKSRALLSGTGSDFLQLESLSNMVLDHNGGTFYSLAVPANANAFGSAAFTTTTPSWNAAIVIGGFLNLPSTPATWQWSFTAPNTWTITVANNGTINAVYSMLFAVLGRV